MGPAARLRTRQLSLLCQRVQSSLSVSLSLSLVSLSLSLVSVSLSLSSVLSSLSSWSLSSWSLWFPVPPWQ